MTDSQTSTTHNWFNIFSVFIFACHSQVNKVFSNGLTADEKEIDADTCPRFFDPLIDIGISSFVSQSRASKFLALHTLQRYAYFITHTSIGGNIPQIFDWRTHSVCGIIICKAFNRVLMSYYQLMNRRKWTDEWKIYIQRPPHELTIAVACLWMKQQRRQQHSIALI